MLMLKKIISGGQTGADRAALDVAIKLGIHHGGWGPKGRIAEDGPIPDKYQLQEMPTESYEARTEQNVIDSDGTLIISHGPLTGRSVYTRKMATKHGRPWLQIDPYPAAVSETSLMVTNWIYDNKIGILNVTGPRATKDPIIYSYVSVILEKALLIFKDRPELFVSDRSEDEEACRLPHTVDEAVEEILSEISLEDRVTMANLRDDQIHLLDSLLNEYLRSKLLQWVLNRQLFEECKARSDNPDLNELGAAQLIVTEIWNQVRQTHRLRVVK
jgi:hypothetical protein